MPRRTLVTALLVLAGVSQAHAIERTTRHGRVRVSGYIESYGVLPTVEGSQRQRPSGILDVRLHHEVPHVLTYLETRLLVGGPPEQASGLGVARLGDTFAHPSPEVLFPEAWVDLTDIDALVASRDPPGQVNLRLGIQQFAWGRLDVFHPTDILNPRRYDDPFLTEEADAKVGLPAATLSYTWPPGAAPPVRDVSTTLIWAPWHVTSRLPWNNERWFPPLAQPPDEIEIDQATIRKQVPKDLLPLLNELQSDDPVTITTVLRIGNRTPPRTLRNGAVGLRWRGTIGRVEGSLYAYHGPETGLAVLMDSTVATARWPSDVGTKALLHLRTTSTLRPRFERITLVGLDAGTEFSGFTVRGELAFGHDRLVPRSVGGLTTTRNILDRTNLGACSLANVRAGKCIIGRLLAEKSVAFDLGDLVEPRDLIEWGLGVDYLYRGWLPVLQVNQTIVLGLDDPTLLVNSVDTKIVAALYRYLLDGRVTAQLGVVHGIERDATVLLARLSGTLTSGLTAQLGYLLIAGTRRSLLGQFHDNDQVFLRLRWAF